MNLQKESLASKHAVTPASCWWCQDWLLGFMLVVATLIAYQPVWHGGFIWDDDMHVTAAKLRSLEGLRRIWTQLGATQQYYPLVHSVFWAEHRLWGDDTAGYHWVNMLLHAFSALLLVKILRQLKIPGAWLAGALFALHPIEVESVAWISELKNTMSGVFYMGAALAYLGFDRNRSGRNYALALGLFVFGLMSKTVISSLPGALLVVFWWQRGKISLKRDVLPLGPFFMVGIGAGLFTAWVERKYIGAEGAEFNFSMIERCLIAGRAIWFYLGKLFWPADLIFMYPRWNVSQTVWWQYLFPAGALLLLWVLVWRRWRGALAAYLFFVGTLFPALGFMNVYPFRFSFVANHFQYLAGLGPLTLAAAGIAGAAGFLGRKKAMIESVLCATLFLTLGTLTWRQCRMYTSDETLWEATLRLNPDCWLAHLSLTNPLMQKGRVDETITQIREMLRIKPDDAQSHYNLGCVLLKKGKTDEAITQYQAALRINPGHAGAHFNLGNLLLRMGRGDEAIDHFQRALQTEPNNAKTHSNLGNALLQMGNSTEALNQYQKGLQLDPADPQIQNNLAWLLATCPEASLRNGDKAVELARQANEIAGGKDLGYLDTLAAAYAEAGRFSEAVETVQRALRLAEAQSNTQMAGALQSEMKLYQAGRPYHSPAQTH